MSSEDQLVHRHQKRGLLSGARKESVYHDQDAEKQQQKQLPLNSRSIFSITIAFLKNSKFNNFTLILGLIFYLFSCIILFYSFRLHKQDIIVQERLVEKLTQLDLKKILKLDNDQDDSDVWENLKTESHTDKIQDLDNLWEAEDDLNRINKPWWKFENDHSNHYIITAGDNAWPANVEFSVAGLYVDLKEALKLDFPIQKEEILSQDVYTEGLPETQVRRISIDHGEKVRFFVGITSECCTVRALKRRESIRETWKSDSLAKEPNVDIKFVLGQPYPERDNLKQMFQILNKEIAFAGQDLLMIRGKDHYKNLRNKTIRLMRYALTHPSRFTHILKTDDDCYVRMHYVIGALEDKELEPPQPRMEKVYLGCIENRGGFQPIRDPKSKWYTSSEEMPDTVTPWGQTYLAGWGYILSRDVAIYFAKRIDQYEKYPQKQPGWYPAMHWEDVLVGVIVSDMVGEPQTNSGFKPAWRSCTNDTAIRHLDVDSPKLMQGLFEQDRSGLWDRKTVQCSSGAFAAGDYWGWVNWRNTLQDVQPI
eukprot:TRINITY_DN9895_c0_g1_i5.p1 TRINITY_DN9895_c0_g1~~TRINITY_DN9895_c0_g1_i5.p1  ORF type:complete len:535 (-),score=74.30 TRINITY_DN9895_c0_g1_i5:104-1708(-)